MTRYLLVRSGYHLSLLAGILAATFALFNVIPSDPVRTILGPNASEAQAQALRRELGIDQPLKTQVTAFMSRAVRLDFGRSYADGRLVGPEVVEKLILSMVLVGCALIIIVAYVSASLAIENLGRRGVVPVVDFLLVSMPAMFSGVLLALLAARVWPVQTFSGHLQSVEDWLALGPPALALALYPMAVLSRVARAEVARLKAAPFVVAARAQGFSEHRILATSLAKNAAVPVLATLSALLPTLFTGAFIVDVIFSIPAAGTLMVKSVLQRDLPMLQGLVLASGILVLAIHLAVEVAYPLLDPRMMESNG